MSGKQILAAIAAAIAATVAGVWWWTYDPRYYPVGELQHAAYPLQRVHIEPMPASGGVEYFGRVRFDLYIGTGGRVERVEMVESTVPEPVRERVVKAFSEARWQPGRKAGGREVRSVKRIEVSYEPPPGVGPRRPMAPDS